jgi:enoyl-CoA hydratase/carnithine racemase
MQTNILSQDINGVRWITISREKKANALMADDCVALQRMVENLPASVQAIVFRGAGSRAFSAGMDVGSFLEIQAGTARDFIEPLKDMLNAVRTVPLPTIAAINGGCIGAGIELACACDLRIAASHARFGLPEIKVGIPTALDAALLQQYIGLSRTKEMILTGDSYGTEEMEKWGLLNRVVPAERLDEAVHEMLQRVLGNTRTVLAAQKRMFEVWQNYGIKTANDVSVDVWAAVFTQPETMLSIRRYKAQLSARKKSSGSKRVAKSD